MNVRSSGFLNYAVDRNFINIRKYITSKTATLSNKSDKETFREVCRHLSKYLIENKSPPSYYSSFKATWEGAIKNWVRSHYVNVDILGKCPVVMNESDMKLLELKYEEEDFCEKRNTYLTEIKQLKRRISKTCDNKYLQKCIDYSGWIDVMKNYFETRSNTINHCYSKEPIKRSRGKPKEPLCHILNEETFKKPSDCLSMDQIPTCKKLEEKKKEILQGDQKTDEAPPKPEDPSEQVVQTLQGEETQSAPNPRDKSKEAEAMLTNQGPIELTTTKANDNDTVLPGVIISPNSDSKMSPEVQPPEKHALNAELSIVPLRYANSPETPKISSTNNSTYLSILEMKDLNIYL